MMKVSLSVIGKFHTFELARELNKRHMLHFIYTGYPTFKLKNEQVDLAKIRSFPWLRSSYMACPFMEYLPRKFIEDWEYLSHVTFGTWVAKQLNDCDIYMGLSGSSYQPGLKAKKKGIKYICDRGSSHIKYQSTVLKEEYDLWGVPFSGVDKRMIEREQQEYDEADKITVPSAFVYDSFVSEGIDASKLKLLPYGVNLENFNKTNAPSEDSFDILFVGGMSLRKGIQYLTQAFIKMEHPKKTLTFAGSVSKELIEILSKNRIWSEDIKLLGHVPHTELKHIMSKSHVLVLPSIEEGLAMVMAQAMACGCPVIASKNTGASDLYQNNIEGFIIENRGVEELTEKLQILASDKSLRKKMSLSAQKKVKSLGGWHSYGDNAVKMFKELVNERR